MGFPLSVEKKRLGIQRTFSEAPCGFGAFSPKARKPAVARASAIPTTQAAPPQPVEELLQHRMNGAPVFAIEISERKAYTSALVGMRTADILPLTQPGQPLYPLSTVSAGRFCSMGGSVPLIKDGQLLAGIGVSGGTVEQDVAIVEAVLR